MFESLTAKLTDVFARLRGRGRLSEDDVAAGLREIRVALLEADVHYRVVKEFIERIRTRAIGEKLFESLTPAQHLIRIVRGELTEMMGAERATLSLERRPAVVLLVGLQGSGKTTAAAKLASLLKKEGRKPVLAAADVARPAAVEQLERLAGQIEVPVVSRAGLSPPRIAAEAVEWATRHLCDVVLVDTAGRLQIDEPLMRELEETAAETDPSEILLVADAMTGQEAVNVASAFDARLGVTGIVLTKLDGDARGGAALSIRHATGRPIKYIGTGEKIDAIEPFHPQRMADRILGMGDVITLIEQAEERIDQEKAQEVLTRARKNRLTLQDFLDQMEEMRKLGPVSQVLERLPGAAKLRRASDSEEETEMKRTLAILRAMTVAERLNPSVLGGSRKKRIARGSGTMVRDVNRVLAQFEEAKRALRVMSGRGAANRIPKDFLETLR